MWKCSSRCISQEFSGAPLYSDGSRVIQRSCFEPWCSRCWTCNSNFTIVGIFIRLFSFGSGSELSWKTILFRFEPCFREPSRTVAYFIVVKWKSNTLSEEGRSFELAAASVTDRTGTSVSSTYINTPISDLKRFIPPHRSGYNVKCNVDNTTDSRSGCSCPKFFLACTTLVY